MTMPVEDLPAIWADVAARAGAAMPDAVMAMADTYARYVRTVVLRRYTHPPFTWTTSPAGTGSPAWVNGDLERSIRSTQGVVTTTSARASVGPWIVYGRIQEEGGDIYPRHVKWLHWRNIDPGSGRVVDWYSKHVKLPPRPYLAPAARETVSSGMLTAAAMASFQRSVWG